MVRGSPLDPDSPVPSNPTVAACGCGFERAPVAVLHERSSCQVLRSATWSWPLAGEDIRHQAIQFQRFLQRSAHTLHRAETLMRPLRIVLRSERALLLLH